MDENTIYQSMSQLVFNAVMRGENREKAIKDAEETLRQILKRSRAIAEEAGQIVPPVK
jgi:hypothetical protein